MQQRGLRFAPLQESTHAIERRRRIGLLDGNAARSMFVRDWQPRNAGGEPGLRIAVPGHRSAATIAALEAGPERNAVRVAHRLERHVGLAKAKFFALVQASRATQRAHQRHQLRGEIVRRQSMAPTCHGAFHVMVGNRPAWPAVAHFRLQPLDGLADIRGAEIVGQQLEAVAHVQAAFAHVFGHRGEGILRGDFAQRGHVGIAIQQHPQLFEEAEVFRLRIVEVVILECVWVIRAEAAPDAQVRRLGRVVAEPGVVETEVDRVQAQAVHAPVQPEADVVQRGRAHGRMVEIEVGLRGQEVVQEILTPARLPLPCDTAEDGEPIVRGTAVRFGVGPDIPVGLRVDAALPAFLEPCMIDRSVAEHLVDHHFQVQPVCCRQQLVEISQRPEQWIDIAVIGDVITEIRHRRLEEGRYPDGVDTQAHDVIEPGQDARQIADAIAIGIKEAAQVDLIDHRAAPPTSCRHPCSPDGRAPDPGCDAGTLFHV